MTHKRILGCLIDTLRHHSTLPATHLSKVYYVLAELSSTLRLASQKIWDFLVGIIWSICSSLLVRITLFGHMQRTLAQCPGGLRLILASHTELCNWHNLIKDLVSFPIHLLDIHTQAPTWHGTHGT